MKVSDHQQLYPISLATTASTVIRLIEDAPFRALFLKLV